MKFLKYIALMLLNMSLISGLALAEGKPKKKKKGKAKPKTEAVQPAEGAATEGGEKTDAAAAATTDSTEAPAKGGAKASYVGSYGMAGCGLGSILIKNNGFLQVFAATTNASSYTQSFGITSGTSNCTAGAAEVAAEQKVFVEVNLAQLSKESAQGNGQHLEAFAELLGCEQQAFAEVSQTHFNDLYKDENAEGILKRYADKMGKTCKRLG